MIDHDAEIKKILETGDPIIYTSEGEQIAAGLVAAGMVKRKRKNGRRRKRKK